MEDSEKNKSHDSSDSDDDLVDGEDVETDMDENPTHIEHLGDYSLPSHLSISPPIECDDIEPHITKSPTIILPKTPASLPMPQTLKEEVKIQEQQAQRHVSRK
ncbi:uncharacterized protein LOC125370191 [Ricinus communis]|uniref:uncharacterized protein LOC125370191 n=1 Tax=Ricinus communis TaxID=3988 RepID=UPI00201A95C2|nr:uncharacterized protein LOC125370191 [Ricinus communis]